jgi:hypothetical protein
MESSFDLLHVDIQFGQKHLLKKVSFLHHGFGTFIKGQLAIDVWIYFRVLCSISLACMFVFMPVSCSSC